jgi:hypothetical protein
MDPLSRCNTNLGSKVLQIERVEMSNEQIEKTSAGERGLLPLLRSSGGMAARLGNLFAIIWRNGLRLPAMQGLGRLSQRIIDAARSTGGRGTARAQDRRAFSFRSDLARCNDEPRNDSGIRAPVGVPLAGRGTRNHDRSMSLREDGQRDRAFSHFVSKILLLIHRSEAREAIVRVAPQFFRSCEAYICQDCNVISNGRGACVHCGSRSVLNVACCLDQSNALRTPQIGRMIAMLDEVL